MCTEFPPNSGADVVNKRQQCPSTAASSHPAAECSSAPAISPTTSTCPANNSSTCHREQEQCQTADVDDGGSGRAPSSERNLDEDSEGGDQRSSEMVQRELAPQSTADVSCGGVIHQRRVFDVASLSGGVDRAVCPIRPKLDVCMLVCGTFYLASSLYYI